MIHYIKKLFKKEEPFNPRTATLTEWEKLDDSIVRTGRELDYRKKTWGHNVEYISKLAEGMIHFTCIFSSVGVKPGDIVLDDFRKGTAKLLVLHCEPTSVWDMYYVHMAVVGYK